MFIKLESKTPQNMKEYSLGIEAGLNMYFAITAIRMARTTFEIADTTEAAICKVLVISTLFEMSEQ